MVAITEAPEEDIMAADAKSMKEEGNTHFKAGKFDEALACYTKALELDTSSSERGVYYKNRAAVHLKLKQYKEAISDTTAALEIAPNDPKALFRRCQAYEQLEDYENAYKDAAKLMQIDSKNTAIQPILSRLNPIIQKKVEQHSSTENKVKQMFDLAFSEKESEERRRQAAQNLIVLARENAGALSIHSQGGLPQLIKLMEGKDLHLQLCAIRTIACMCLHNKDRTLKLFEEITMKRLMIYVGHQNEEVSTATSHIVQNIIKCVTRVDDVRKEREKHEAERLKNPSARIRAWPFLSEKLEEDGIKFVHQMFTPLTTMLSNAKVSANGRDNIMELLIKYVTKKDGVNWSRNYIQEGGLQRTLEVAGTVKEHKTLPTTENSRMHASLLLNKVWEDLYQENDQTAYRDAVDAYFQDMFGDNMMESKLEAVMALTALLQGPFEEGNRVLGKQGVLEIILAMADSNDAIHTKYAVEALVNSASKKERCSGVIKQATPILKQLYQSKNDYIKVRALVGLCKLGSLGGHDVSARTFAEGSTQTLAKACRKFLVNPSKDIDLRKWAAEGLAYLTLDADVKEDLVADTPALRSLMDLAKATDKGVLYPMAQILVNVTNSYDVKKIEPELEQIAKFAKQHIPETHEKDKREYAEVRTQKLIEAGVINALVALSSTDSESSKELLARVYLAVSEKPQNRGLVIQQGGVKALIPLALEATKIGKFKAAHALAKIAITNNPAIAFPGQRACEVVRPLLQLLNVECEGFENYESLMALTNLASMNDTVRKRIVKEKGVSMVEHYCFEEHEELKRAAMECMCNLAMDEDVAESFEGENDRVKMFLLYCTDDDLAVVRAGAGGLAMLSDRPKICHKIITCSKQWYDILTSLMVHDAPDIQHRGVHIVMNLLEADKEIGQRIVESNMFEMLMALSKIEEPDRERSRMCAERALEAAVEHKLIEANPQAGQMKRSSHVPKVERIKEDPEPEEQEEEEEKTEENTEEKSEENKEDKKTEENGKIEDENKKEVKTEEKSEHKENTDDGLKEEKKEEGKRIEEVEDVELLAPSGADDLGDITDGLTITEITDEEAAKIEKKDAKKVKVQEHNNGDAKGSNAGKSSKSNNDGKSS